MRILIPVTENPERDKQHMFTASASCDHDTNPAQKRKIVPVFKDTRYAGAILPVGRYTGK